MCGLEHTSKNVRTHTATFRKKEEKTGSENHQCVHDWTGCVPARRQAPEPREPLPVQRMEEGQTGYNTELHSNMLLIKQYHYGTYSEQMRKLFFKMCL